MINIAIDGPAGAGKSTIAKQCAKRLNYIYVDTGAMYRAIAYYCLEHNLDVNNETLVSNECQKTIVTISYKDEKQLIFLDNVDVTDKIRQEQVGITASVISAYKSVREHLLNLQRDLANTNNVIMDGRDIGTNILPNADLKIFLTASSKVRAHRRFLELTSKGVSCDEKLIEEEIINRDNRDMNRKIAPLKKAKDAILVDSSDMTIDEVINAIINLATNLKGDA